MSKFRRQLMMASMGEPVPPTPPLPYDAEVEWLESDGYAYIDTEIVPTANTKVDVELALDTGFTLGNTAFLFGTFVDGLCRYSVAVPSLSQIRIPSGSGFTNVNAAFSSYGSRHTLSYKFGAVYFDGSRKSTVGGVVGGSLPIWLFGRNADTAANQAKIAKIISYSWKVYDNTTLLRDYKPVRKNGVGYLYDSVSQRLFGNANSVGAFTYGNDVTTK